MLVKDLSESTSFFKCELYNGTQWIQNLDSNPYDMSQRGWQKLYITLPIPPGISPVIRIAVEKRPYDSAITGEILLGNLQLTPVLSSE